MTVKNIMAFPSLSRTNIVFRVADEITLVNLPVFQHNMEHGQVPMGKTVLIKADPTMALYVL